MMAAVILEFADIMEDNFERGIALDDISTVKFPVIRRHRVRNAILAGPDDLVALFYFDLGIYVLEVFDRNVLVCHVLIPPYLEILTRCIMPMSSCPRMWQWMQRHDTRFTFDEDARDDLLRFVTEFGNRSKSFGCDPL
jgi:hypothetical protein